MRVLPCLALLVPAVAAAVPAQITHSGRLFDSAGSPVKQPAPPRQPLRQRCGRLHSVDGYVQPQL